MTVICWKNGVIAADSLCLYGSHRAHVPHEKIKLVGSRVYGCTGSAAMFDPMINWFIDGANPEKCPSAKDDNTRLLIFEAGRCVSYRIGMPYPDEYHDWDAWGSEAEFACGAMAAGASAEEAVEFCIKHTNTVGGPVQVIDLHQIEQKKTRPKPMTFGEALDSMTPADRAVIIGILDGF